MTIRRPRRRDEAMFLAAARRSRKLHHPWVSPPATAKAFQAYLARQLGAGARAQRHFLSEVKRRYKTTARVVGSRLKRSLSRQRS